MKLSIIIPVYNEEVSLPKLAERIQALQLDQIEKEIIFINDASTDKTAEKLNLIKEHQPTTIVLTHPVNQGKGAAIRSGIGKASGDIILIQDADLEYHPNNYPKLLNPFLKADADAVYGSRFLGGEYVRIHLFWHYIGNRFLTLLSNICTNLNLTDMETGYKLFKRNLLNKIDLTSNRFGFEVEITAKLAKLNAIIYEVPISYEGRSYAQGKKITWKDGIAAVWHIIRFNFFK